MLFAINAKPLSAKLHSPTLFSPQATRLLQGVCGKARREFGMLHDAASAPEGGFMIVVLTAPSAIKAPKESPAPPAEKPSAERENQLIRQYLLLYATVFTALYHSLHYPIRQEAAVLCPCFPEG